MPPKLKPPAATSVRMPTTNPTPEPAPTSEQITSAIKPTPATSAGAAAILVVAATREWVRTEDYGPRPLMGVVGRAWAGC